MAPLAARSAGEAAPAPVRVPPFAAGGEFTVGAEDELILLHDGGAPADAARVVAAAAAADRTGGTVSVELYSDEVELGTVVCRDAQEVGRCLSSQRATLHATGARTMAVGLHPTRPLGDITPGPAERYETIFTELAGLLRTTTAAFQVHVGLPDAETAITAFRGLRADMPLFRALAAGSPYWHGHDSGLASGRSAVVRAYPRSGIPPAFASYDEYVDLLSRVTAAAQAPDYTYVWWDLRLQPRYGTVEIRVMDAQASLDRAVALTSLAQGLARAAVERPPSVDLPSQVIEQNDFRACRYGLDARIVDNGGSHVSLRDVAAAAVARARSALAPDGLDAPLEGIEQMLAEEPEPERQRRLVTSGGFEALQADLVERTRRGR
jgi:glutamate---cysteine ligase / carboxylate-amine ligase